MGDTSRLGRPITAASINREKATLRHMLRLAEEWGYIDRAPRIRMGKESQGRLRFLLEPEADRLLEVCAKSPSRHLYTIVVVALAIGMRQGEIFGLTWNRVDLTRGVFQFEMTKTGKRREVPMNGTVYTLLAAWPEATRVGHVFATASGRAVHSVRTAFENAVETAKIEDFRFHDLRHTCASWLVMAGRPLLEVKDLLGHATITMTMRYAVATSDGFFARHAEQIKSRKEQMNEALTGVVMTEKDGTTR
jgi:integrase